MRSRQHEIACLGGTVGGALLGGAVGSVYGGGVRRDLAVGAGAAVGGVAGHQYSCG